MRPADLLHDTAGLDRVLQLLLRIKRGVFT